MARQISIETTTFYRALVTTEDGIQRVYGPYTQPSACVDRDARWRHGARTTVAVQEQRPTADGLIEWVTIKTRG